MGQRRRCYSDFIIHNIDECCWMKDAWPVQAQGIGGRHYRGDDVDQNFDNYSVEYTFADGTKLFLNGRNIAGCYDEFASYAHGTKGSAVISTYMHTPAKCRIYKGQNVAEARPGLGVPAAGAEPLPAGMGRPDRGHPPGQALQRGASAAPRRAWCTSMGRMAGHTGQVVTCDEILEPRARVRPRRGQADDGLARPAAGRPRRQVPDPAAGHRHEAGILNAL